MTDQNSQFFAILTKVGEAKQANANALGLPWRITHMGVGDANGTDSPPDRLQTSLINERRRAPLNRLDIDPTDSSVIVAEQVIPADIGGWWIREIGLYDEDGDLIAIANCPPSYKPLLVSFSEDDCTKYQESAALPVGAISCGSVPCAERRQAMALNRRRRMRKPCASLGHTTP